MNYEGNDGYGPPGIGSSYIKITEIGLKTRNIWKIKIESVSNNPILVFSRLEYHNNFSHYKNMVRIFVC